MRRWARVLPLLPCMAAILALSTVPAVARSEATLRRSGADSQCTRIILLGTGGGPVARKFRSQPANLLIVDGKPYLIDAGAGVVRQLVWAGFQPPQIRTIFLMNLHIDHEAGLESLISFIWFNSSMVGRIRPAVQLYGPPSTRFLLHSALAFLSVSERIFSSEMALAPAAPMFNAHDIDRDGTFYQDGRIRVTAVENALYHFKPGTPSYGRDKSYAFRFDTPQGAVVFTGDTGPSAAVTRLARGAQVLVSEVIDPQAVISQMEASGRMAPTLLREVTYHMEHEHLTPDAVGRMASAAHVKAVILTHFGPGLDSETTTTQYTAGVERHFSGAVIPGADLLEYDLCGLAGDRLAK